ncbi:PREDICTED: histone-lysine N-methyltransferase SETMAR-like [Atta cephalotes]|uniref:Mariner Mos1 transposase n=1 Tax=Atta cephalotes TaxID=12957 RepID=A0A158NII5_ATTCE|nr:PREDICTED: histone-lysine N-methyltransferase SETMAR-like [Atta cephalotes]
MIPILHEQLDMKKLSARWVPRLLTVDHKRDHEFLRRFITVDETWIHYFTPETKEQSKQWTSPGETVSKKAKTVKLAGKMMATVFWDARGIIHIDYLPSKQMINGNYYCGLIGRFNNILKKKRSHLTKKVVHTCPVTKFNEFRYELLPQPYLPNLVPCDYFLFPNLKKWFEGKRFTTREQLIAETEVYFEGFDKSYYSDGLKKLENH